MKEFIKLIKFAFFSVSAGLIQMTSFTLLNEFTNFGYWICYLTALVLSVLWNFTLNRKYTFASSTDVKSSMFKVFCYYLIFTPVSTIFGNFLVNNLSFNEYIVTGLNMILNFATEYPYQKYYVFKDSKNK